MARALSTPRFQTRLMEGAAAWGRRHQLSVSSWWSAWSGNHAAALASFPARKNGQAATAHLTPAVLLVAACLTLIWLGGCADTVRRSVSVSYDGAALTYSWERGERHDGMRIAPARSSLGGPIK